MSTNEQAIRTTVGEVRTQQKGDDSQCEVFKRMSPSSLLTSYDSRDLTILDHLLVFHSRGKSSALSTGHEWFETESADLGDEVLWAQRTFKGSCETGW